MRSCCVELFEAAPNNSKCYRSLTVIVHCRQEIWQAIALCWSIDETFIGSVTQRNLGVAGSLLATMYKISQIALFFRRCLHTSSMDVPTESLKRRVMELEKIRKKRKFKKNQLFVEVPESRSFLDTASLPMYLTVVGIALFAKLLMMHDESRSQELIERKIKKAPAGQGTVRMITLEEWEEIREVRPRTPFESKLARPNARIRTGERPRMEDLRNWTIDVLTDALTRAEDTAKRSSSR